MAQKIVAPQRRPRVGGIKSIVGEFIIEPRLGFVEDLVWEDSSCDTWIEETQAGCIDQATEAVGDYAGDATSPYQHTLIGPAFGRFKSVSCFLGGDNDEQGTYEAQAVVALTSLEDREIERILWNWATDGAFTDPTVTSLTEAIAFVEDRADGFYVGRPVLMMSRHDAQVAFEKGALTGKNGELFTANGTPVLATGAGQESDWGTVVSIGQPAVYATPLLTTTVPLLRLNTALAIAQRAYGIGVDCDFKWGITVTAP